MTFGIIPKLCADIVLGQSFLNIHNEVIFKLGGSQDNLIVSRDSGYCGVSASKLETQRLFKNLDPGIKPIATRSRRFNDYDKLFIKEEVRKLLNDGVIEPSYSPWRAQVLVTKNERHKRRMVIDYSQTVNRYTLLDAYPLPNID